MSRRRERKVEDMAQASRMLLAQPGRRKLQLGNGGSIEIRRLDWVSFELLWQDCCSLLAAQPGDPGTAVDALEQQLATTPQLVLKLASLSSGIPEEQLAQWDHAAVLELATAALRFNFSETAGLRDFFGELAALWSAAQAGSSPAEPPGQA